MHDRRSDAYNHYGIRAEAAQVADADATETNVMKCSIQGCPGQYEDRRILHAVRVRGQVVVVDHVPVEVCCVCGDTLLHPDTVRRLEEMTKHVDHSTATAPLMEYAA